MCKFNEIRSILGRDICSRFVNIMEEHGSQEAVDYLRESGLNEEKIEYVTYKLFKYGYDDWRFLLNDQLQGKCLHLYCGHGRTSVSLNTIADELHVIDESINNLKFLKARSNNDINTVCTDLHHIPYQEETFDCIVVSDYASFVKFDQKELINIYDLLKRDGHFIITIDELNYILSAGEKNRGRYLLTDLINSRKNVGYCDDQYLSSLEITVVPQVGKMRYSSYGLNQNMFNKIVDDIFDLGSYSTIFLNLLFDLYTKTGLDTYISPSKLKVFSKNNLQVQTDNVVLFRGANRSTLIYYTGKNKIEKIEKFPSTINDECFNQRAYNTIQAIRNEVGYEHVPEVKLKNSKSGDVLISDSANGKKYSNMLNKNKAKNQCVYYQQELDFSLGKIADIQNFFTTQNKYMLFEDLCEYLLLDEYSISRPELNKKSINLPFGPVHGDLTPENIYVTPSNKFEIIDWEYGSKKEYILVDSALFVIKFLELVFGDFYKGINEGLMGNTKHAAATRSVLNNYCRAMNVSVSEFLIFLGYPLIRQAQIHEKVGSSANLTQVPSKKIARARYLYDNFTTIYNSMVQ